MADIETTSSTTELVAWWHPKRGKAHRITSGQNPKLVCTAYGVPSEYTPVFLGRTAPEDRCRICWRGHLS